MNVKFEYNEENAAKMLRVAEALQGTANSLDDELAEVFGEGTTATDMAADLLVKLDEVVLECESCGWWCESGEVEDGECADCQEVA